MRDQVGRKKQYSSYPGDSQFSENPGKSQEILADLLCDKGKAQGGNFYRITDVQNKIRPDLQSQNPKKTEQVGRRGRGRSKTKITSKEENEKEAQTA